MEFNTKIRDILELNPTTSLKKGTEAKKIAMADITENKKFIESFDFQEFTGGTKFKNGDTLVARITPCLENGKTAFVDILEENEIAFGSTEFFVIRSINNLTDPHYLYYLMRTPNIRNILIKSMTGTSGRQRAQKEALLNTEVNLPPLNVQQAIGSALNNLDEKIRHNTKTIANFEELSQTLFKRWFIDFEFPDENGNPYKSSGGEFKNTEVGNIPVEWRVANLLDIMDYQGGSQPPSKYFANEKKEDHIRLVQIRDFDTENHLTYIPYTSKLKLCNKDDILIARYGAALGRILYGLEGAYNVALAKVIPKHPLYKEFLWNYLKSSTFYRGINNYGERSAQSGFNKEDIKAFKFAFPNNTTSLKSYSGIVINIFENIQIVKEEITDLSILRDTLLPKLMSGEIELPKDLEV